MSGSGLFFWVLCVALGMIHGPTLASLLHVWTDMPQNSHGLVVPIMVGYLLWLRGAFRECKPEVPGIAGRFTPQWNLHGCLILLTAELVHIGAWVAGSFVLSAVALVGAAVGVLVVAAGLPGARRATGPILLLFLAVPLPEGLIARLTAWLQEVATGWSAATLELLGTPVVREGHTLVLSRSMTQVAGPCDGLSMITGLIAVSLFVVMIGRRTLLVKLLIVLSALPTAVLVNTIRITTTLLLFQVVQSRTAQALVHDIAGWLMMPVALGITLAWLRAGRWVGLSAFWPAATPDQQSDPTGGRTPRTAVTGPGSAKLEAN